MKKIKKILNGEQDNHLLPFLWMHGEEEFEIRNYIQKISETGIKAVTIESRPHPEFVKERWWEDVRIIIDECKKQGMKLWILDDSHFPTGYAAGELEKYPHLQKKFLRIKEYDFVGPRLHIGVMLDWVKLNGRPNILEDDGNIEQAETDFILGVVAARKTAFNEIDPRTLIDISSHISGETLYWDIPEGEWTIFVLVQTKDGGEPTTQGYLNPLVKESTDILIEAVYESHYAHFSDEFGTTIAGFFSDEPRFGNIKGPDAVIGNQVMDYPWSDDLLSLLSEKMNISMNEVLLSLPLLQRGEGDLASSFRYTYMDTVSELYSKNFSQEIGKWCSRHGVEYIGHVIEDNNAHARLGYGAGHFFKSMAGQHMAGIDVVLHQLMPDYNNGYFKSMTSTGWDGEFFTYGLAKMGASLGYLDANKCGRTMCEVFGAYGWNEGLSLMKFIADHMLASGVNYFVPHAFTMATYPDPDCPPHLYAQGHNPQFTYTSYLVDYMNRMATLISDGRHGADIAVLYHGEAEWAGRAMLTQKPMRALTQSQVEFDVVALDYLASAVIEQGFFIINNRPYYQLVVPYMEKINQEFVDIIQHFVEADITIYFIDQLPLQKVNGELTIDELRSVQQATVVSLDQLPNQVKLKSKYWLQLESNVPSLRYFHYEQDEQEIILLFNESVTTKVSVKINVDSTKHYAIYDAVNNQMNAIELSDGSMITLQLDAAEMVILITDVDLTDITPQPTYDNEWVIEEWDISFDSYESDKVYPSIKTKTLPIIGKGDIYEDFVGTISYRSNIALSNRKAVLNLQSVNEIAEVCINGISLGAKIGTPYRFDLSSYLQNQVNQLEIKVTNNLGRRHRDYLSQYTLLEPLGIYDSATILYSD